MLDINIIEISTAIKNLDIEFKVTGHNSPSRLYQQFKKFTSKSHMIEFFYNRSSYRREINVSGYIRVTVRNKTPEAYINHVTLLLELENILSNYWCHVCYSEMALDFSSEEDFNQVANKVVLKYSRIKDIFHCDGSRSKSGKILKIPGHDSPGENTSYFNKGTSSRQAKIYSVNEDIITDLMEDYGTHNILEQQRMRIEVSFKRSYLRRQGLNSFSEILAVGPDLFINQVNFIEFDEGKFRNQIRKSKSKQINESLCEMTDWRLNNLLKKTSTEILTKLLELLPLPARRPYQITKDFGNKLEFPNFVFDVQNS